MILNSDEVRIAVLGNCATQFFSEAIEGAVKLKEINANVYDAEYNQIDTQLLDNNSDVYKFCPNIIILWLATEKLYEEFLDSSMEDRYWFAEHYASKIENYWRLIERHSKSKILQLNFSEIDDKCFGGYSCKVSNSFIFQIRKLNYLLQNSMQKESNVYPVDLLSIQIRLGQNNYYDAPLFFNAKVPVALNAIPYIAIAVADVIATLQGKIKKCIILDLDNTIWGGVIGDDGIGGIEIGELGRGHAYSDFQRWLKQLKQRGIILAICSKNDEAIAREPFEHHEEMILSLSDISVFVANWEDKVSNIKLIQETLSIGRDSLVFIDDNPFERNLVRECLPEVEVPELPEDPALYVSYLQSCNLFETSIYASASSDRTKFYQAEYERRKTEASYQTIEDYLMSLEMMGEVRHFEKRMYARISELTQRSNQFNLRTVRYTENEIEQIACNCDYIPLYFTLKDKFGDYGLIAVVILEMKSDDELFVNTWLMSCRVLKRGMEEFTINKIIDIAKNYGFKKITAEYIPTLKNAMVSSLYSDLGFSSLGENKFFLDISNYRYKANYVSETSYEKSSLD